MTKGFDVIGVSYSDESGFAPPFKFARHNGGKTKDVFTLAQEGNNVEHPWKSRVYSSILGQALRTLGHFRVVNRCKDFTVSGS
jgi:hypothetical protein